jgi:cytochrome c biogenesis protein CcmG, thiol:disulfide interchange protein DsbE
VLALLPLGVLAALVAVLVAGARTESSADAAARYAPPFSTADLRSPGETLSFDGTPTRPTVVNFFASWCIPCREELPYLAEAARRNPAIDFIGIDVRDVRNDALLMLEDAGVGFPAGVDRDRKIADAFELAGMPTTVFIAPGGRIVATVQGGLTQAELAKQLSRLEAA